MRTKGKLARHGWEIGGNWRGSPCKLGGNWREQFLVGGNWRDFRGKLARFPNFKRCTPLKIKDFREIRNPSPYILLILKIIRIQIRSHRMTRAGSALFVFTLPDRADYVGRIIGLVLRQGKSVSYATNAVSRPLRVFPLTEYPSAWPNRPRIDSQRHFPGSRPFEQIPPSSASFIIPLGNALSPIADRLFRPPFGDPSNSEF